MQNGFFFQGTLIFLLKITPRVSGFPKVVSLVSIQATHHSRETQIMRHPVVSPPPPLTSCFIDTQHRTVFLQATEPCEDAIALTQHPLSSNPKPLAAKAFAPLAAKSYDYMHASENAHPICNITRKKQRKQKCAFCRKKVYVRQSPLKGTTMAVLRHPKPSHILIPSIHHYFPRGCSSRERWLVMSISCPQEIH